MTTAYTSLLGLALPVTGELQGTWGDVVNNSITSLLDNAVAGTTTLSTDADVTLTTTTGASNQARQAILLCSGARTGIKNITAPASSKAYIVINATTGGYAVVVRGAGPTTGVTVSNGEKCLIAWDGSDFVKVSSTVSNAGGSNTQVQYNSGGVLAGNSNFVFDGTNVGIGRAPTAGYKLDVAAATAEALVESTTGTNRVDLTLQNTSGVFSIGIDNSAGGVYGTAYSRAIFSSGAYPVTFWTASNERMRIDSSGNVGVVAGGKLLVGTTTTALTPGVQVYGPDGSANISAKRYSNNTTGVTIQGVKTRGTSPTDLTTVVAGDNLVSFVGSATQGTGTVPVVALDISVDPNGTVSATSVPGVLTVGIVPNGSLGVGIERLRIDMNGNMGLGMNSPASRLVVRSTGTTSATTGFSVQDSSGNAYLTLADDGSVTSANLASAVGYKGTPLNEQSAAYTLVLTDQGKSIVHPASDNNARTFTIPANSSVAFPIGTTITFINMINTVTISITTDTLYLAGSGSTGSRTLAAYGMATAVKLTSTTWIISGNGLT